MIHHLRPALVSVILFTLLLGLAYPLAVTGVAQLAFPRQAGGSLLDQGGTVVGSALVGQPFAGPGYLHPRPSAAGEGYDAGASSGSNLGPLDPRLMERVQAEAEALRGGSPEATIPADAVTASASGLDPDISPAYALLQVRRVAEARGVPIADVEALVAAAVKPRLLGIVGQPRVNVLETNLELDARFPLAQAPIP